MTVPDVPLDDLRFQRLVYEARDRVHEFCSEWTEANVSDPGITLIELFAWMTDQLSYRVNRLPEKLHVALLALLDVHLYAPTPARTQLRFLLEKPLERPVPILARTTEVSTARAPGQDPVVFQTTADFTIAPVILDVCLLQWEHGVVDVSVRKGVALPAGDEQQRPFSTPPQKNDALLLGFAAPLSQLVLRLEVDCAPARGVGVNPATAPLVWEASVGEGDEEPSTGWQELGDPLVDSTEGFNQEGVGVIELQLPPRVVEQSIDKYRRHWVRCRVTTGEAESSENVYDEPPLIRSLRASAVGALVPAEHSQRIESEVLGHSDGTPGQVFGLQRAPILALDKDEGLEVREHGKDAVRWTRVDTFAQSGPQHRHYKLDESAGEVEFGPAVRQVDGSFRFYGATPPGGAELRFVAYRVGGGTRGNVNAGSLTHLRRPVVGVSTVVHPVPAKGGSDAEGLASARARSAIELRTGHRAITAQDFEQLCHVAAPDLIARARCLPGVHGEDVCVLIVPRIPDPRRRLEKAELTALDDHLVDTLKAFLNERRLVGVTVRISTPEYVGVTAAVSVTAAPFTDESALRQRIEEKLYTYLNPIVGGAAGSGWEFQRALGPGELYPLVQGIDGVQEITLLRVYQTDLTPGGMEPQLVPGGLALRDRQLIASGLHQVKVERAPPR
ncbi:MAG TPA: putative baseplate assembly protein [Solirubrobacteraceae bacterium]|jgi:predicted phage baseplate assembly protein|nr:putative baseplate assembly protein [Solirubrobacteraceae bacterium]